MGRQARGMKGALLLAFEHDYGITPTNPAAIRLPFNKNTLTAKQNLIESNTITGRRDPTAPGLGQIDVSGNVEFPLDVRNIGHWMTLGFNVPTTTDNSTSGSLTGDSGVTTTIATWTAVTAGAFAISIDGVSKPIGPIDFSTCVTMTDVTGKIQTAVRAVATGGFTTATVVFDAPNTRFVITSGTKGSASAVSVASAPTTGTDISGAGFMKCATGTAVAGAALYKHVWKVQDDMPSATLEKGFGDLSKYALYPGCKMSKFALSAAVGNNELTANADIMGANEAINSFSMSAAPTSDQLLRFNNFQAAVIENGSVLGSARKMDVNIDFGLDGDTYCLNGQGTRTDIAEGIIQPSGSIEALFKETTLLDKAINGMESSLKLTFANGPYSLEFLLPELIFERATPTINGPKGILLSLNYKSYYSDSAENSAVQVTLINDVASYAIA
ncbi:MAG: phage tail tube protein [Sporomusaceae bacterium]|nr:phage tail tube protein [Sporomusaceae bacterium]